MLNKLNLIHLDELRDEDHAGIAHFERFQQDRNAIPNSWAVSGRVILFFGDRVQKHVAVYVPALVYIHGLIYASHGHPSGWETRMVPIDDKGLPSTMFGKEDLTMLFRYAVFEEKA